MLKIIAYNVRYSVNRSNPRSLSHGRSRVGNHLEDKTLKSVLYHLVLSQPFIIIRACPFRV